VNNVTASAGATAAAPNCWTPNKLGASVRSLGRSTVVGNEDLDAREIAKVGLSPRGRQGVGGGYRKYDREDNERSSTRPGSDRQGKRRDRKDGRRRARALVKCGDTAGRRTSQAPTDAAPTKAQTATRSAAETAAPTQTEVSTHTRDRV